MRFPPRFWWYNIAGWTAFAILETLFFAAADLIGTTGSPDLPTHIVRAMGGAALMMALTPAIVACARTVPLGPPYRAWPIAVHVLLGMFFTATFMGVSWLVNGLILEVTPTQPFWAWYLRWASSQLFWYFVLVVGTGEYLARRRLVEREVEAARLTAQLAGVRLELLKMQLHPHFLFNTLNVIAELIHQNPDAADRMVGRLGDLLRATMRLEGAQRIRVREELDILAAYLDIQQVRFQERLAVTIGVEAGAGDATLPPLLLQPLVENAIRHGIAPRASGGRIDVSLRPAGERLLIRIADDGLGIPDRVVEGVGLRNTRARLEEMYPGDYQLTLQARQGGGTELIVQIPLEMGYGLPSRLSTPVPGWGVTVRAESAPVTTAPRNGSAAPRLYPGP